MLFPASIGLKTLSRSFLRLLLFYQSQRRASFPKKADFAYVRSLMSGWALMENHDNGWDLFAVVRSCRSASRPPPPPPQAPARTAEAPPIEKKPFFCMDQQAKPMPLPCPSSYSPAAPRRSLSHAIARSKKRRNQQKRVVCQVPADGLAADMWAWRKYGQKPIKGSPYPRGYYRCSSSKGCSARKQVERSRADPGTFILTYTGEHNHPLPTHRNSLAGSTRQKLSSSQAEQQNPLESSPERHASGEDEEEDSGEEEEEEEGILLVEDMEVVGEDEVFFMGDNKLDDDASSSIFPEPLR